MKDATLPDFQISDFRMCLRTHLPLDYLCEKNEGMQLPHVIVSGSLFLIQLDMCDHFPRPILRF